MNKANNFEMADCPVADCPVADCPVADCPVADCPVAELDGMALDYAVAIVEGGHSLEFDGITWAFTLDGKTRVLSQGWGSIGYQPSKEWAQGGPIIERERIKVVSNLAGSWHGQIRHEEKHPAIPYKVLTGWTNAHGPTPLVAAMRCYVVSKLGGSVKIPKGLIEG